MSSVPGPGAGVVDFIFKKTGHVILYAILYALIKRALSGQSNRNYVLAFLICVLYGLSDEIHQSFVPGRSATIMDVGFDALGASLMFLYLRHQINGVPKFFLTKISGG